MINYWYTARPNEIFLDLDSRRAFRRAVSVLVANDGRLPVEDAYVYPTRQDGHFHIIVRLYTAIPPDLKAAWSLWMGNDRLRIAYVLARRTDRRVPEWSGDLLVTPKPYYRCFDCVCQCEEKHKPDEVTMKCPAMRMLLGKAAAADYFARTGERRVRPLKVRVPWGKIESDVLRLWAAK
jgi:hypothetical protein